MNISRASFVIVGLTESSFTSLWVSSSDQTFRNTWRTTLISDVLRMPIVGTKTNRENLECANGGYFFHGKNVIPWKGYESLNLTLPPYGLFRGETPYQSKYVHQCHNITAGGR